MKTTNKERFIKCRDEMEDARTYTWDEFAELVDLEIADCNDDLEWRRYVARRNSIKQDMNRRASAKETDWRLQIIQQGHSLHKVIGDTAVREDVPHRCKRIAQHMQGAKNEWEALSSIVDLLKDDQNLLKNLIGLISGTIMMIKGAVSEMKSVPDDIKKQIVNLFDEEGNYNQQKAE